MNDLVTIAILALSVYVINLIACLTAFLLAGRKEREDPYFEVRLQRLRSSYELCEQQLAGQFEVSKRQRAEIEQLQAEVRALKFEREARESGAEPGS